MKKNEGTINRGLGNVRVAGRTFVIAISAALMLSVTAGSVMAGSHEGRRAGDMQTSGSGAHETKMYGTVENLPTGLVGVWTVNGREIVVTADTLIKEKHGKVKQGAYIKAEGSMSGKTFTAREIEVERPKGNRR